MANAVRIMKPAATGWLRAIEASIRAGAPRSGGWSRTGPGGGRRAAAGLRAEDGLDRPPGARLHRLSPQHRRGGQGHPEGTGTAEEVRHAHRDPGAQRRVCNEGREGARYPAHRPRDPRAGAWAGRAGTRCARSLAPSMLGAHAGSGAAPVSADSASAAQRMSRDDGGRGSGRGGGSAWIRPAHAATASSTAAAASGPTGRSSQPRMPVAHAIAWPTATAGRHWTRRRADAADEDEHDAGREGHPPHPRDEGGRGAEGPEGGGRQPRHGHQRAGGQGDHHAGTASGRPGRGRPRSRRAGCRSPSRSRQRAAVTSPAPARGRSASPGASSVAPRPRRDPPYRDPGPRRWGWIGCPFPFHPASAARSGSCSCPPGTSGAWSATLDRPRPGGTVGASLLQGSAAPGAGARRRAMTASLPAALSFPNRRRGMAGRAAGSGPVRPEGMAGDRRAPASPEARAQGRLSPGWRRRLPGRPPRLPPSRRPRAGGPGRPRNPGRTAPWRAGGCCRWA